MTVPGGLFPPYTPISVEMELKCHYRVDVQAGNEGCDRCHAGTFWTIVYRDGTEDIEIGTAWGDKELAEDICDLMNMAYEAGLENTSKGEGA